MRRGIPFRGRIRTRRSSIVRSDDGVEGYASGDDVPDRALLERLLVGRRPLRPEVVHGIVETVDFHHGRNWIVEVAVWDLLGTDARRAALAPPRRDAQTASSPTRRAASSSTPDERVRRCRALRDAGVRAVKLRLHSSDWRADLPVIEAVREAVGPT